MFCYISDLCGKGVKYRIEDDSKMLIEYYKSIKYTEKSRKDTKTVWWRVMMACNDGV